MSTLLWSSPRTSPGPDVIHSSQLHQIHMHPRPSHQVAFGASAPSPVSLATSSVVGSSYAVNSDNRLARSIDLGFGFGFGDGHAGPSGTSGRDVLPAGTVGDLEVKGYTNTMPIGIGSRLQEVASSQSPAKRRRQRSESHGIEMLEEVDRERTMESREYVAKRTRRDDRPVGNDDVFQVPSPNSSTPNYGINNDTDLGKALASLSKPALLTVFTCLLTQQPSLKPLVLSLLPPPSLDSFTSTLLAAEKKVIDALPTGTNLRNEYIWSRIRGPLEEFASEARLALGQFCPSPITATSIIAFSDPSHPTTTFAFLHTLTLSVRKLEVLLPRAPQPFGSSAVAKLSGQQPPAPSVNNPSTLNPRDPLLSFLPPLFNQWHLLATRLSTIVNTNGHVLSAETIRSWFRQLDALVNIYSSAYAKASMALPGCDDVSSVGRRASEAVRDRFVRELGWLVGVKASQAPAYPTSPSQASPQSQHLHIHGDVIYGQQLQLNASHTMDSKMMMDHDGERSDEEL